MHAPSARLDRLHAAVRGIRALHYFTWTVRVLLALGFIPSGLTKVLDLPFTQMDPSSSDAAHLFDALHRSGFLYEFIGICQMGAAFLLLVPSTALLGACVYLPIIAGIEVITMTMDFRGTWVITSLMLLGCVYLLCWDYHRLKYVIVPEVPAPAAAGRCPSTDRWSPRPPGSACASVPASTRRRSAIRRSGAGSHGGPPWR